MDNLERRVETLEQLPERVTSLAAQIVQLRDEMRSEFSATRAEARQSDEAVVRMLREEMRQGNDTVVRVLREEIRAGDEETRRVLTTRMDDLFGANERHMRLLHEDLVQRIATLKENRQ
jgi:predicted phage gp36 major capsid-like protein